MNNVHNELKKEFQLERMILFSDAIFAIAITLMAIEIKVPVMDGAATDRDLLSALGGLIFKFYGLIISFFIIGIYWTVHHRIFVYVENYNQRLLWLNLLFLFSIVLMPFSSGMYGEYSHRLDLVVPYGVYVFNICLTGYFNYRLWRYISNHQNKIASSMLTRDIRQLGMKRCLTTPAIFLLSFIIALFAGLSLWFGLISRCMPMLIPVAIAVLHKKHNKKYHPLPAKI